MSDGHVHLPIAARVRAVEERILAAGLTTDEELDGILSRLFATASPVNGARIVARAWTDVGFRDRLLADGSAAVTELGFQTYSTSGGGFRLRVVANSPALHNVIVCTLCSCYPVSLLGPSPSWYKSLAYRSRVVRAPREVLAEFGLRLPADMEVAVWDTTAETRYMVLPVRPDGTGGLTDDELARIVTANGLIGTAAV